MSNNMDLLKTMMATLEQKEIEIRTLHAEIDKYKQMLLVKNIDNMDDAFLVYSNEFEDDKLDTIGENLVEFGQIIYDCGHQLIAKQESNRNFSIYLSSFHEKADLNRTIAEIEKMIKKKRKSKEKVDTDWYIKRIIPEMRIMANKMDTLGTSKNEFELNFKNQQVELKKGQKEVHAQNETQIKILEKSMEELKSGQKETIEKLMAEIGNLKRENEKSISTISMKMESLLQLKRNEQSEHQAPPKTTTPTLTPTTTTPVVSTIPVTSSRYQSLLMKMQQGVSATGNLNFLRNNKAVMYDLSHLIYSRRIKKLAKSAPPSSIVSLERQSVEKGLYEYFDMLQKDLGQYKNMTDLQIYCKEWFDGNSTTFINKISGDKTETVKTEFASKFGLRGVVGTVHLIPFAWNQCTRYLCLAISDLNIVYWTETASEREALVAINSTIRDDSDWAHERFATHLIVPHNCSAIVQITNEEVFKRNNKVVQWINNNFHFLRYNIPIGHKDIISSIPCLYNHARQFGLTEQSL